MKNQKRNQRNRISFEAYQAFTRRKLLKPGISPYLAELMYLQVAMAEEVGELSGLVKKVCRDLKGKLSPSMKKRMAKELGDQLWYMARIAEHLGFSLEDVATFNIKKLNSRIKRGTISSRKDDHR